jgi:hypothetical protein
VAGSPSEMGVGAIRRFFSLPSSAAASEASLGLFTPAMTLAALTVDEFIECPGVCGGVKSGTLEPAAATEGIVLRLGVGLFRTGAF